MQACQVSVKSGARFVQFIEKEPSRRSGILANIKLPASLFISHRRLRVGNDLLPEGRYECGFDLKGDRDREHGQTRSMMSAIPCPTPTHIVHKAYRPCRRRNS